MIEKGEAPEEIGRWVAWAGSKLGRSHWSPEIWVEQTILETGNATRRRGRGGSDDVKGDAPYFNDALHDWESIKA